MTIGKNSEDPNAKDSGGRQSWEQRGNFNNKPKKKRKKKHRIRDNIMAKTSGYIHKG